MRPSRRRGPRALALCVAVAAGLGSRSGATWLPDPVVTHAGDALYATTAYLALALLAPGWPIRAVLAASLGFCLAVEASQTLQTAWMEWLRSLPFARLVLGQGFDPADPWRYLAGALSAAAVDRCAGWTRLSPRSGRDYDGSPMKQRATVVVYRTRTCPFCTAAEDLLQARGIAFDEIHLDESPDRRAVTSAILPGHTTVPLVLIDDAPIGGYDALRAMDRSGALTERVFAAD
ncbi:MAG: DUF2809 domain-containing protein [Planctomycetota bacterium]|nr:DUF2809 domain-containing protein [Planctomycetota bacterium]